MDCDYYLPDQSMMPGTQTPYAPPATGHRFVAGAPLERRGPVSVSPVAGPVSQFYVVAAIVVVSLVLLSNRS